MSNYRLVIELLSDSAFGRGDGVAGRVDAEVQHDEYGCPFLGGRTLKGLLREECINLLYALDVAGKAEHWWPSARRLFGEPGSTIEGRSFLHIGDATLADDLRDAVAHSVKNHLLSRTQVLESLTAIRYQTAVDVATEASKDESLRAIRVILRQTILLATIYLEEATEAAQRQSDLALLLACVKALRLAGTGRNRGVGEIRAYLQDEKGERCPDDAFTYFVSEVTR